MLTVSKYELQCGACPTAWDVTTSDGGEWYVRYRWGWLTVHPQGSLTPLIFEKRLGDNLDGSLDEETMRRELRGVLDFGRDKFTRFDHKGRCKECGYPSDICFPSAPCGPCDAE